MEHSTVQAPEREGWRQVTSDNTMIPGGTRTPKKLSEKEEARIYALGYTPYQTITYREWACLDEKCGYTIRTDDQPYSSWWSNGAERDCENANRQHEKTTGHRIVERITEPYWIPVGYNG